MVRVHPAVPRWFYYIFSKKSCDFALAFKRRGKHPVSSCAKSLHCSIRTRDRSANGGAAMAMTRARPRADRPQLAS